MFEKILFPTDFSEVSLQAFDYLKELRGAGSKEIIILNVINQRLLDSIELVCSAHWTFDERTGDFTGDEDEILSRIMGERMQKADKLKLKLEALGYQIRVIVKKGFPVKELLKTEREENVSLVVIGSHGRKNLSGVFLGDVSEKVVRKCVSPVLVIKRNSIPVDEH